MASAGAVNNALTNMSQFAMLQGAQGGGMYTGSGAETAANTGNPYFAPAPQASRWW